MTTRTPTPGSVSLTHAPSRTSPALIVDDATLWVCLRCGSVCCSEHATLYACERCGAQYALHDSEIRIRLHQP